MSVHDERALDTIVIQNCLSGDQNAYKEIVIRYQKRAIALAMRHVRNIDDAQDIVQEAFIKAYKGLHRFEPGSSFYTWFYRILTNVCIDFYRKNKKRNAVEYDDSYQRKDKIEQHNFSGNTRDLAPDAQLDRAELHDILQKALATLSESHRNVIVLREVDGLSYEEIAEMTESHVGTVMSRLHHARKNLQEALKPHLKDIGEEVLAHKAGTGVGTKRN
jgi:RNA polymerase sigma-70 factor, ECF subfamily